MIARWVVHNIHVGNMAPWLFGFGLGKPRKVKAK